MTKQSPILRITVAEGAVMPIPNRYAERPLEYSLRYGHTPDVRFMAAEVVQSFDYLLSQDISTTEAIRRLRILRAKWCEAREAALVSPAERA